MPHKVEVSHKTIIFTAFFLLSLWFLYYVRDIILELLVAVILVAILDPFVKKLSMFRIPKAISILISYILLIGVLGGAISLLVPTLVEQTTAFVNVLPTYLSNLGMTSEIGTELVKGFIGRIGNVPGEFFKFTFSVFSNFISVVTVLVFAFYMLLSRDKLDDQIASLFGDGPRKENITRVINSLENKLGGWARGQVLLMFIIGILTFVGLTLLKIPFALPLSILAGLFEIIPFLGPIVAAIPAVIIGFGISPVSGFAVAGLALLIQQLENYLLVPKIMEKSVGISPVIVLIALAIGARLAGLVGIIISVPLVITLEILIKEYFIKD